MTTLSIPAYILLATAARHPKPRVLLNRAASYSIANRDLFRSKMSTAIDPKKIKSPKYAARCGPTAHHPTKENGWSYVNPWTSAKLISPWQFMKTLWSEYDRERAKVPKDFDPKTVSVDISLETIENPPKDRIIAHFIGHASFLVQMNGLNILTDPICSYNCAPAPAPWFGLFKRYTPPALSFKQLKDIKIDVVIISHNHYDHLDYETITALGNEPSYFVPLGKGSQSYESKTIK